MGLYPVTSHLDSNARESEELHFSALKSPRAEIVATMSLSALTLELTQAVYPAFHCALASLRVEPPL
jgi:hypothetical protein